MADGWKPRDLMVIYKHGFNRSMRRNGSQSTTYEHGYRVGFKGNFAGSKEEKYFINNNLSFSVMYHKDLETVATGNSKNSRTNWKDSFENPVNKEDRRDNDKLRRQNV
ncbi:transmembrane 9 superfamily member 7 [Artemisia annua]|uniref:Transmembrane 9 superfamily member 7 n=1 Tax=Artemisia annua TaxID=35608 RepID=A0A2U1KH33_ARTAN|nr:transmembrane 9 superfamily member 7 [Artemisia annua]